MAHIDTTAYDGSGYNLVLIPVEHPFFDVPGSLELASFAGDLLQEHYPIEHDLVRAVRVDGLPQETLSVKQIANVTVKP